MPTIDAGYIEFIPDKAELSDDDFVALSRSGFVNLGAEARSRLNRIYYAAVERRSMNRPTVNEVNAIWLKLLQSTRRDRLDRFFQLMTELAAANPTHQPAEAHVYFVIAYELGILCQPEWQHGVETGAIGIGELRSRFLALQADMVEAYRGRDGGEREHDLGFVINALADVYLYCGGVPSANSYLVNRGDGGGEWIVTSKYVRFCEAFISLLPRINKVEKVKIGALTRRVLRARANVIIN
jgi:hypothetical protein